MQTIYLDNEDDIVSICDRLDWLGEEKQVVLVLPVSGRVLEEWLDLVRLRRKADSLRLELGLVTANQEVRQQAQALGLPLFRTERQAKYHRQNWWRGRRGWHQPTRPGANVRLNAGPALKSLPDEADRREIYRRMTPRPGWAQWLIRYAAILLFFMTLAIFFVGLTYIMPGATITLQPQLEVLEISLPVVGDPQLQTVAVGGGSVPARVLSVTNAWQAEVKTTGTIEVADAPARGQVVFVNRLAQPVRVPAGTRISTSSGTRVVFQVLTAVDVPGVIGGTAEANVVAIEPGPQGNVAVNQINRVEGSLALQLEVRNLEATEGGGVRIAPAVTEADQERLHAQVLQYLQALAVGEMEASLLPNEFLAAESLRVVEIFHETYSHFPSEPTDRLALEIRAQIDGTAVDASQVYGLVYEALVGVIRPGYTLLPDTIQFESGEILGVDSQGRVSFTMLGQAQIAATLNLAQPLQQISGQETEVAMAYLYQQLPLAGYPSANVWPNWFGRIPYLASRVQTVVNHDVGLNE